MVTAVIFDCFGVLIGDGLEILCQKLEKQDPDLRQFVSDMIHQSNRGYTDPEESNSRIAERLGISVEAFRDQINNGEVRNEQVLALVREVRQTYKMALLSNIGKGSLKRRFSDSELAELFDVVVPSAEVGMMKPDHEIYEYTARQLGVVPEECVFIDDRENYVTAAREVGMQGIVFTSAAQLRSDLELILPRV